MINYADKYCCSGWTIDVLIYLANKLSYEFELYFQAEKLVGVYNNETGKWNGVIQDIISGKGDIAIGLSIFPDRCSALDCSLGYLVDGFNAIFKLRKKDISKKGNISLKSLFQGKGENAKSRAKKLASVVLLRSYV